MAANSNRSAAKEGCTTLHGTSGNTNTAANSNRSAAKEGCTTLHGTSGNTNTQGGDTQAKQAEQLERQRSGSDRKHGSVASFSGRRGDDADVSKSKRTKVRPATMKASPMVQSPAPSSEVEEGKRRIMPSLERSLIDTIQLDGLSEAMENSRVTNASFSGMCIPFQSWIYFVLEKKRQEDQIPSCLIAKEYKSKKLITYHFGATFLQCHITSVSKLLLAALHGNEQLREEILGTRRDRTTQHFRCWELCIETFAWILHLRVRAVYGRNTDRKLGEFPFPYIGLETKYTLDALAGGVTACRSFLKSLWGDPWRYNGSAYFYSYGNKDRCEDQTPWARVESSVWMIILPTAVVAALTCTALKYKERKAAATKYWISIPMWLQEEWQYYHTVVEEAEREKANGKRQREDGANCLHLVPHSADKYTT